MIIYLKFASKTHSWKLKILLNKQTENDSKIEYSKYDSGRLHIVKVFLFSRYMGIHSERSLHIFASFEFDVYMSNDILSHSFLFRHRKLCFSFCHWFHKTSNILTKDCVDISFKFSLMLLISCRFGSGGERNRMWNETQNRQPKIQHKLV